MNEDNLELLTAGSVWVRNKGKKSGEARKVLFVTNTSLPERAQEQHPPQVIYADDDGNLYNRDIADFFEQYSFFNIDPELEGKIENLFVFSEADYDDPEEEGSLELPVAEDDDEEVSFADETQPAVAKSLADLMAEDEDYTSETSEQLLAAALGNYTPAEDQQTSMTFIMSAGSDAALTPEQLSDAFIAYAQEPNKTLSLVQHKLLFRLSKEVTINSLTQSFTPDDEEQACVDAFAVTGPFYQDVIAWTDSIGVFPELAQGVAYAAVMLGTEGSTDESLNEAFDSSSEEFSPQVDDPTLPETLQEQAPPVQDAEYVMQTATPTVTIVSNQPPQ